MVRRNLPDGSRYSTVIKSAGLVALIVMKAHAMNIRKKSIDAYDIWFCLANYPGKIESIAKAFKPHVGKNSVKTALALHHKQIPPSLHFEQPNPNIDFAESPFYLPLMRQSAPGQHQL